ncbi:hypothetical protein [Enterococcus hirae]|uniref:hypothetical protein n=1 Tax=Enterococcus hirae TaxID=1354 RepID=UPI001A967BEA|nr:hypothetical protein [Enterococcus hirae]MBO1102233.1 hypothetical protein [Enterococcus hirae]
MKKKIFGFVLLVISVCGTMAPSVNATTTITEKGLTSISISTLSSSGMNTFSDELSVKPEELKELEKNIEVAMRSLEELNDSSINRSNSKRVPVSENLYLEMTLEDNELPTMLRATYNRTITSTLQLKNLLGHTIVTLKGVGVFQINGSTSKPIDAYGSYSGVLWSLSSKSASKGATAYNAYVRVNFKGSLNIGISSISVTIQSFNKSATIYCNANGGYSSSWN